MSDDGWTNKAVQGDPQGYLKWQEEQKTKEEEQRREAEERADYEQFRSMFIERGGDPSDARSMYKRFRNDQALEEAKRLDKLARGEMRSARSRAV
jgi:hypothetical protein